MREYTIVVKQQLWPLYVDIKKAIDKSRVVKVTVKSVATKTHKQLGYYHVVVLPAIQQELRAQGNEMSQAEINEMLNDMFFSTVKTVSWIGKDGVQYVHQLKQKRSKSGATIDEFALFLDQVIRWANTELGCYIAPPTVSQTQGAGLTTSVRPHPKSEVEEVKG